MLIDAPGSEAAAGRTWQDSPIIIAQFLANRADFREAQSRLLHAGFGSSQAGIGSK
jgi:hypothetical protein